MPTRIVAHWLLGGEGIPAPDYVPESDEGIVSGAGATSGTFLRITQNGELCYSRCFRFRWVWANADDGGVDYVDKMK